MGQGLTVKCKRCGAEKMYSLGVGMAYFPLENLLDRVVRKRNREKVRRALAAAGQEGAEYSHALFACPECETLHSRFYIKIVKGAKILYETRFRCGDCRRALSMIGEDDVGKYRCSSCGEKALEPHVDLMWD